jgi:hypothetical protein
VGAATIQHWLKTMHDWPGRDDERYWQRLDFINDPHFLRDGEPKNQPSYRPGDLVVIYLSGTYRCPAAVRVVGTASFDPKRVERSAQALEGDEKRWGWVTDVEVIAHKPLVLAPGIGDLGVESRALMRRARLKIEPEQYATARRALRSE